jgi:hypothetical protein
MTNYNISPMLLHLSQLPTKRIAVVTMTAALTNNICRQIKACADKHTLIPIGVCSACTGHYFDAVVCEFTTDRAKEWFENEVYPRMSTPGLIYELVVVQSVIIQNVREVGA